MPSRQSAFRKQKAVLWRASGRDQFNQPTVGAPEEILVRWLNKQAERLAPDGTTVTVDATVSVGAPIAIGSRMWLGSLNSWLFGTGSAGDETDVMYVKTYNETQDLKNRDAYREVGLMRFKDSPT